MALLVLQMHSTCPWLPCYSILSMGSLPLIHCACTIHKCNEIIHFSKRSKVLMHYYSDHSILECYNLFSGVKLSMRSFFVIITLFTCWHYNLAQFYGPGYVVVKIRWDELSHMGLDVHKVVLLWCLVNGVINIERCYRVMYKGDGRMHFSETLIHDEITP